MPLSGVVILIDPLKAQSIHNALKHINGVTTYGLHKERYIITVFEADDEKILKQIGADISHQIEGVLGVYPTYMNFEESIED